MSHQLDRLVLFADWTGLFTVKVKTQQSVPHYGSVFLLLFGRILNMYLKKEHILPSMVWRMIIAMNIMTFLFYEGCVLTFSSVFSNT